MSNTINIGGHDININQYRNDWALALMSQGVIVRLSMGRWRGTAKLTPDMLGLRHIDEEGFEFSKKYLSLGMQKLLPLDVMRNISAIERIARDALNNHSFTTVWGRFVPFTAFESWKRDNDRARQDFIDAAKAIGNKYDEIVVRVGKEYRKLAKDVWARLYPQNKNGATESFIEDFVSKVLSRIPPREDIVESFKYDITYFIIPMPSFIEENVARAEEIRESARQKALDGELEESTKRHITEEYRKKKEELIDSFLKSTVQELRKYVGELCDSVLSSLGQHAQSGDVPDRLERKLKDMIKKVRHLNFHEDKEVNRLLNELESEMDKFEGERTAEAISDKLKEIVQVTSEDLEPEDFNTAIGYLEV